MRRPVRWIVGIALGLLFLAGAGYWNALRVAERTLEEGRREVRAELARLRARNFGRPALLQPEQAGDASEIYEQALLDLEPVPLEDWQTLEVPDWDSPTPAEAAASLAVAERLRPMLSRLRSAFLRPYARTAPPELGEQLLGESSRSRGGYVLEGTLLACGRSARAAGRHGEALERVTEAWLFAADVARGGFLRDIEHYQDRAEVAMKSLEEVIQSEPVSASDLSTLAARLEALSRARPMLSSAWELERLNLLAALADDAQSEVYPVRPLRATRHDLWSTVIARSAASLRARELPTDLSDSAATRVLAGDFSAAFPAFLDGESVGLERHFLRCWREGLRAEQRSLAREATLRLAVAIARFEADSGGWAAVDSDLVPKYIAAIPTSPFDPSGLRFRAGSAWSRGTDGKDDGGRPVADGDSSDCDIVVEVKGHR